MLQKIANSFRKILIKYRNFINKDNNYDYLLSYNFKFSEKEILKIKENVNYIDNKEIYDCFIFDNEFELLDLRLNEYYDIVDKFIIVEFSKTNTGEIKSFSNFQKYKEIWSKFSDKIIFQYVNFKEIPNQSNLMLDNIENYRRNYIHIILEKFAKFGDIIFLSDLNEFWNIDKLEIVKKSNGLAFFMHNNYYKYINNKKKQIWIGTIKYNYGKWYPQELKNLSIKLNDLFFNYSITDVINISNATWSIFFKILCDGGSCYSLFSNFDQMVDKKENINKFEKNKKQLLLKENLISKNHNIDILNTREFESILIPNVGLCNAPKKIEYFISKYPQFYKKVETDKIEKSVELIGLIFSSIDLLKEMYNSLLKVKNKYTDWEISIKIVANDAKKEVIEYLKNNNIPHEIFKNKNPKEYYINRTYRAYNYAAFRSKYKNIIFVQSDMVFTDTWFENLVKYHNGVNIPVSRLIEYGNINTSSWNILSNCGNVFNNPIDYVKLSEIQKLLSENMSMYTGLYMPSIFVTKRFIESGGFPEGNVDVNGKVVTKKNKIYKTGDKWFFENVLRDKFCMNHITVYDSLCYHLQEGEKRSNDEHIKKSK